MKPTDLDDLCPDWRERETFASGPGTCSTRLPTTGRREGDPRAPPHGALPAEARCGEEGEGGKIVFAEERDARPSRTAPTPILVAGEEAGLELPFGCREGICHTCIGKLCSGQIRDLRNGKVYGTGGRDGPYLHQRARGRHRDRTVTTDRRNDVTTTEIESPLARLSDEQIEELGKMFDAMHDEVYDDLGGRDRRYITSMIEMHRRLAVHGPRAPARLAFPPAWVAGTAAHLRGQDPREHGDRPQRPARAVGLDERSADPLLDLGLGHGLDCRGLEALPQLRPSHVHEHPRQGQGPGLRDHADRSAAELASRLSVPADLQRASDDALRVGRGLPRPRLRGDPQGREVEEAAAQGAQGDRRQGAGRRSPRTTSPGRWSAPPRRRPWSFGVSLRELAARGPREPAIAAGLRARRPAERPSRSRPR